MLSFPEGRATLNPELRLRVDEKLLLKLQELADRDYNGDIALLVRNLLMQTTGIETAKERAERLGYLVRDYRERGVYWPGVCQEKGRIMLEAVATKPWRDQSWGKLEVDTRAAGFKLYQPFLQEILGVFSRHPGASVRTGIFPEGSSPYEVIAHRLPSDKLPEIAEEIWGILLRAQEFAKSRDLVEPNIYQA